MKVFRWFAGVSILISLLPLFSLLLAMAIASAHGCQLDEGSAHPCMTLLGDVGQTLYVMAVSAWYLLLTAPYAVGLGFAWIVVEIVRAARGKGRSAA